MTKGYVIKHFLGTSIFFALLFICAGSIEFKAAWYYIALGMLMFVLSLTVLRISDDLMGERAEASKKAVAWDKKILGLSFLSTIGMFVFAGLDDGRFHWSQQYFANGTCMNCSIDENIVRAAGLILTAIGQLMFLVAQKQNPFFSSVVRIQSDRGHAVHAKGLYAIVRHPAYLGNIIQAIGFPLLFYSLWVIIPVFLSVLLTVVRTFKEDAYLKENLAGYSEYAATTRGRLFPF
jgi:protein-S-isoprenylcysteine O-methyltransferase Ste14